MVTINSSTHPGNTPTFEYTITINGVSINLSKNDFLELTEKLGDKIGQDYKNAKELYENFWAKRKAEEEFFAWLDGVIFSRDNYKEPLSPEIMEQLSTKIIDFI